MELSPSTPKQGIEKPLTANQGFFIAAHIGHAISFCLHIQYHMRPAKSSVCRDKSFMRCKRNLLKKYREVFLFTDLRLAMCNCCTNVCNGTFSWTGKIAPSKDIRVGLTVRARLKQFSAYPAGDFFLLCHLWSPCYRADFTADQYSAWFIVFMPIGFWGSKKTASFIDAVS